MNEQIDYEQIRKRVEKRYAERMGLVINAVAFVMVNLLLWIIFFTVPDPEARTMPWPLFPFIGWGIGLFAHAYSYWQKYGGGAEAREAAIAREVEKEFQRLGYEKPKRDQRLRLDDDGELIEDESEDDETTRTGQRNF